MNKNDYQFYNEYKGYNKNNRYQLLNESSSSHCCFSFTVIDTDENLLMKNHNIEYRNMCESFEEENAVKIVNALNNYK